MVFGSDYDYCYVDLMTSRLVQICSILLALNRNVPVLDFVVQNLCRSLSFSEGRTVTQTCEAVLDLIHLEQRELEEEANVFENTVVGSPCTD